MHDKPFWTALAEADYAVPAGESVRDLTAELLTYLGSPDHELRDGIAYTVMAHWAMRGVWTPDDFRFVLYSVSPNLLAEFRPGRENDEAVSDKNGVILRSFSALTLSLVAYGDWKHPFSEPDEFDGMVNIAGAYLLVEQDLRGYDGELGWIHAVAHTADALKFLARGRHATSEHLEGMLMAIATKLAAPVTHVFIHSEDERLAMAAVDIVKREKLTAEQLTAFVTRLLTVTERVNDGAFDSTIHAPYMNVKNFLRALYFRLSFAEPPIAGAHDLARQAFDALKQFKM